jgi:urea carboxylase-associated protein 2
MTQLDTHTPEQHRQRYLELEARARERAAGPRKRILPPPIPPADVVSQATIPGGWYATLRFARGQALRLVNPSGRAAVAAMIWNADDTSERYNAGDTVKLQWTARLTTGHVLFSDMGRVLAAITADSAARHDPLVGPSTRASNLRRYGDGSLRNSRDNLLLAAGKHGLGVRDVPPCLTFFAAVATDAEGRFHWQDGAAAPGDAIDLRAEMNLLVALSACPHPLDPAPQYDPQPAEAIVWRAPPPGADDPCRHAGEEAARGYANTEAYFA